MLELIVIVLVTILGGIIFLFMGKKSNYNIAAVTTRRSKNSNNQQQKQKRKEQKKAQPAEAPEATEVRKARGRTVPGLGMEADVVRLHTTESRQQEREKKVNQELAIKKAQAAALAPAPEEKKEKKKVVEPEAPKVDFALEMQKKAKEMNSRIEKYVNIQNKQKASSGKSDAASASTAAIKVSKEMRATSYTWKN